MPATIETARTNYKDVVKSRQKSQEKDEEHMELLYLQKKIDNMKSTYYRFRRHSNFERPCFNLEG